MSKLAIHQLIILEGRKPPSRLVRGGWNSLVCETVYHFFFLCHVQHAFFRFFHNMANKIDTTTREPWNNLFGCDIVIKQGFRTQKSRSWYQMVKYNTLQIFQFIPCIKSGLPYKSHEKTWNCFSVMLVTDTDKIYEKKPAALSIFLSNNDTYIASWPFRIRAE